jgi:hypothetical protein
MSTALLLDLKPENILCLDANNDTDVLIADFGFSIVYDVLFYFLLNKLYFICEGYSCCFSYCFCGTDSASSPPPPR